VSPFSPTLDFAQHHVVKFVKTFFKEKDIGAVLDRLDRLTQDEARTTAAHMLAIVHGLVQNMKEFVDGEQSSQFVIWRLLNIPFSRRQSVD